MIRRSAAAVIAAGALVLAGCSTPPSLEDPSRQPQPQIPVSEKLTTSDILNADLPFGPFMSPDGSRVLWIKARYKPGAELPSSDWYVTNTRTLRKTLVHSVDGLIAGLPAWSPDSTAIAYVASAPDETNQVFTIPASGGSPTQVTNVKAGVLAQAWRDNSTIAFTAQVGGTDGRTDDSIHVTLESDDKVRLFEAPIGGGKAKELTHNDDQITSFWISPDGRNAITVQTRASGGGDEYYMQVPNTNYLVDLSDGSEKQVLRDVRFLPGVTWSPDSSTAWAQDAYTPDAITAATVTRLWSLDVASGAEALADLDWPRGIHSQSGSSPPVVATRSGLVAALADGTNPKLAQFAGRPLARQNLDGQHQGSIFGFDVSRDGKKIAYLYSTPSTPPQMYLADLSSGRIGRPRQFTDLNPGWSRRQFVRSEVISWQGALGDPVEGILYYPSGYEPGKQYPLVLMIHGGPFNVDLAEWPSNTYSIYPYQVMAQRGAFVLAPNYHGSSEYGLDFARSIRDGKYYEFPVSDLEGAIDRLTELGMVDENRLGTLGWSNGSILSNALIARDQRFKAASLGAGGDEWLSLWGPAAQGYSLTQYYFGASPIENPELYKDPAMAPFYDAPNVTTPAVMYQGDVDQNVPPGMTWNAFRALQKYGKAPVDLFIFPGEGHDPILRSHQKRKITEDLKLFDKYLFGSSTGTDGSD